MICLAGATPPTSAGLHTFFFGLWISDLVLKHARTKRNTAASWRHQHMEMPVTLASSIKQQKTMKAANELPQFPHELAQQPMNHGWLVFYGNYPHSHDLSLTVGMKMPIVYELTMYCKCQAGRSTPVKCLCKSHCQGVRKKSHRGTNEILSRL